jgi:hypothetical protein
MSDDELAALFAEAFGPGTLKYVPTHAYLAYTPDDGKVIAISYETLYQIVHMPDTIDPYLGRLVEAVQRRIPA